MADYDVIVIGAGCGGLTAGAVLAKEGRSVLLLEQSERIGGCCSTFEKNGYKFDLGASIIEDVEVIDSAFRRLGSSLNDEVDLISCDPVFNVIMQDGTRMKVPVSLEETERIISDYNEGDGRNWKRYSRVMDDFMDKALNGFFTKPANTTADMIRMFAATPGLLKFGSLFVSSYQDVITKYFRNERVRESLSFHPFYTGLPPELSPGIFAMLPYSEHRGIFYARGGMIQIPAALERMGRKNGLEVRLGQAVEKILVKNRRACGVRLEDGTEISSKLVVSNINAKTLYLKMIGPEHLGFMARTGIKSYQYSIASPMIYLGVNYEPPLEAHHTLATRPLSQTNAYFENYYEKGLFPTDQFGIISWTSHSDPGLAPPGKHVIVLTLAPGAYRLQGSDWDSEKQRILDEVLQHYSKHYIPGLKDHVEVAEFSTPLDFERRLRSPEGAIYALRQDLANATVFRPSARSKSIKGLYLTGASTHPGGGVPTVIASGLICADLINRYES